MRKFLLFLGIVGLADPLAPLDASGGGEEVVVVYNSSEPESKALAEYYAEKRQVPRDQVFGFDLSRNEEISRAEFRDTLQQPLAQKLAATRLWRFGTAETVATNNQPLRVENVVIESKIRYAVLCYGVPLKIRRDPDLKEPGDETLRPEFQRNEAAVDSELALLPLVEKKLPLSGMVRNPAYAATNPAVLHPTNGVLLVSRLDGPTPAIARGLIDKALQAESDGLWGRAYFDLSGTTDPGLIAGDQWIRNASEICRRLGFETLVDTNRDTFPAGFPMSQIAFYLGWYTEDVSGPFTLPNVEFMPGAFAYHLHSFSAASLRTTNRHWTGPLLAKGATITMGCVAEPYLGGTPDVAVFIGRLVLDGFTFGEAACAAQSALSWQTTVIGDPLYRPFGKLPQWQHLQLAARKSKLIEWSHLRVVNLNQVRGTSLAELAGYIEEIDTTRHSAVLTEKLGDLCAAQGKPSSAIRAYQAALKLDPSPQQRIRLRLALGEILAAQNLEAEAFQDYQKLLEESPDYPDRLPVSRKLLALAQKLGQKDEAMKYEGEIRRLTAAPGAATTPIPDDASPKHRGARAARRH